MQIHDKVLFLALLSVSLPSLSQIDERKADIARTTTSIISLQLPEFKISTPVSTVHVYDVRFDTSCLGIASRETGHLNLLKFKKPLAEEVKNYYNSFIDTLFTANEKIELHCFIKKLILSDYFDGNNTEKEILTSKKHNTESMSGILFMAEFYGKQENMYIPLCRFDTLITGMRDIYREGGTYVANSLIAALSKAVQFGSAKTINAKRLGREEIDNFNNQRFSLPILQNPPSKGIYLTFKNFLNNETSADDFFVEKDKKGDFLYIMNKSGEAILLTDLWGYCDGKEIYIYSANNYFRLQRTGNSFKTYGAKDFTNKRVLGANFRMIDVINPNSNISKGHTRNKYVLIKDYFLLDMDTGELY